MQSVIMAYEYEPMDVDLSSNSIHAMDISYNEIDRKTPEIKIKEEPFDDSYINNKENAVSNIPEIKIKEETYHHNFINDKENAVSNIPAVPPTVIKRFSLNMPTRKGKPPLLSNTILAIIFAILASASIVIYQIINVECSKELDLIVLKESLTKNLYGQPQAIEDIINTMQEKAKSKLLMFYGGTGVGKTLTISLILENLYHYTNIYHYTMPTFIDSFSADLMLGLTLCPNSMIIVDDLIRPDTHVKEHVRIFIEKSENLNKNITIILVFNCDTINDRYIKRCDYSFYTELKESFSDIKTLKAYIRFDSLTEEHLRRCIEKEMGSKSIRKEEYEDILKNFNVSVDGCKGVHKKVKLLNL